MRVKGKNNILLLPKFCSLHNESESEFYYPGELSHAELLQSPIHSESKERNLTLLAKSSQLSQKPTSKQAVKETTFPDKLSNN